jgi:hypothetical protein
MRFAAALLPDCPAPILVPEEYVRFVKMGHGSGPPAPGQPATHVFIKGVPFALEFAGFIHIGVSR